MPEVISSKGNMGQQKWLIQYSGCREEGDYVIKCSTTTQVVVCSQINGQPGAGKSSHNATPLPNLRHIEALSKPDVKQVVTEVQGSPPLHLDILKVDADIYDKVYSIPKRR